MVPVMKDKIRFESLKDGSLDLMDLALIHDAINVYEENHRRLTKK